MNKKMKIGLIGCGKQSVKHIPVLKKLGIEIILADLNIEQTKIQAREFNLNYVNTIDELFENSDISAIDICTPTPSHYPVISKAVANNKHFFCEKPLASTHEETLKIDKLLRGTGLVGMVGYLYRFHPAFELVNDTINAGIIGKPYFASFRLGGRGGHRIWKHKKNLGGGAIKEMMVHMLDLILWYFGEITDVKTIMCDTVLKKRPVEGKIINADAEDLVMVNLETESGVRVVCESDLITPSYMNYIEIQGTNGSIITSILDYFPSLIFCKEPRGSYQTGNNVLNFSKVNLFEKQLKFFVDCINNGTMADRNTVLESVNLLQLIERIGN
jgi:predicted dehydrogenase